MVEGLKLAAQTFSKDVKQLCAAPDEEKEVFNERLHSVPAALDAGVSVHIVRDYLLRGLLGRSRAPRAATACSMTPRCNAALCTGCLRSGYRPGRTGAACRALDAADGDGASAQLAVLRNSSSVGARPWPASKCNWPPSNRTGTARGESAMNSPEHLPLRRTNRSPATCGARWPCSPVLPFADSRHCASRHDGRRVHREHWGIAALTLTGLFVLSVTGCCGPSREDHDRFPASREWAL